MAAYAALVSLMNNIEQIQSHTRLPIQFDQKQSDTLLEKVKFFIDFLESYNYHADGEEMKDLESSIRDAAYAAEDIIETHVVDRIKAHSRSSSRKGKNKSRLMKKFPTISVKKVMEDMELLKEEAMQMKDKKGKKDPRPSNLITGPLISSSPVEKNTTVGFDEVLTRITGWLLARQPSRQIIPIVGMGGIGKTTLAKNVYEKPFIVKHFDFCAWVSISLEYDMKKIIAGILSSESSETSDSELGQKLHQKLYGRRYLIVLDDMWSIEAWEKINMFLPDNNNGSRIIVTTRNSSVSTVFGSSSLEMSFLDEDQSWNLFCEKVFTPEGCPSELEEVGRKIVKNCKGLPLSIVVIGGLLAKSERRKEYWEYIAGDTNAVINSADDEHCRNILSLSYQNLPIHLKSCFLYFGAFSEDKKISASMLVKLWVAEGFLKSNSSKGLEVLGEEYLNDLISRNLIMVDKRGRSGRIRSCMIHDLLRDICLQRAENEKFVYTHKLCNHDDIQFIGSQRRISFHTSESSEEKISQVLDTLRSGSMARTLICDEHHEVLPLQHFRLMRVVNYIYTNTYISYPTAKYSLDDIFQLVNSRLITIKTIDDRPNPFPCSLCLLWNLQTLIVGNIDGATAPLEIWEMTELRHLQFSWDLYLPDPPLIQQTNGQEGGAIMKKLLTLQRIKDFRLSDDVVKRIPNIKKLNISYGKKLKGCLKSLGLLENLENLESLKFELSFEQQIGPALLSNLTFPNSLKRLFLIRCGLHWKNMSMICSLPLLEVLKLRYNAFIGAEWVLNEEEFPSLKILEIWNCCDLVHWKAEDTHFPCLEHLVLRGLNKLAEIPSGIGDIPTLQKIELSYCSESAEISAKKILEEQQNLGNVGLQVSVFPDGRRDLRDRHAF